MQKKSKERGRFWFSSTPFLLLFILLAIAFGWYAAHDNPPQELTYLDLMQISKGEDPKQRLQSVVFKRNGDIVGELVSTEKAADGSEPTAVRFRARGGLAFDTELQKVLIERKIPFKADEDRSVAEGLASGLTMLVVLFTMLIGGFLVLRWMSGGSGPFTFGRSRHKLYAQKEMQINFEDVAGIDEAVAELREIVDFLKTPEKYQALGGRIPKGVLLVGPPGTGKTLLARAVAGEAHAPFFSMSGSDFVEMFVGVGASRVRDLFGQAESRAPCIIFIDELDALGKTRGGHSFGGHDEREQTLNQLLVEMDGFDSNRGVIIMAATNRPETLDPALLRPGRFDRQVVVDRPDVTGREAILKVHARNVKLADDVDLRHVAGLTPGSVGADLANIVNEAALLAARKNRDKVTMPDFNEAVERGAIGLERKSRIMTQEEKLRVAYHEAGHALVGCALPNTSVVHKVTIIPRGIGALGYVLKRPEDDRHLHTQGEIESEIKCALGGTVAEEIVYGEISNGATSDLQQANGYARRMVAYFGMSGLGRVYYPDSEDSAFLAGSGFGMSREYSEQTAREIDLEVRSIIQHSLDEVREILSLRRGALDALAQLLIEKEVVDGPELKVLLASHAPGPKLVPASEAITPVPDKPATPAEIRDSGSV